MCLVELDVVDHRVQDGLGHGAGELHARRRWNDLAAGGARATRSFLAEAGLVAPRGPRRPPVAASSDAVTDAADPTQNASGGLVTLTGLAILLLIYRHHVPEPLFGMTWVEDTLDYAEVLLGALLLSQLARLGLRRTRAAIKKIRTFAKATTRFFKQLGKVRVTFESTVPAADPDRDNDG
jgi:hypothetical protein